jgi:hypothetical protein
MFVFDVPVFSLHEAKCLCTVKFEIQNGKPYNIYTYIYCLLIVNSYQARRIRWFVLAAANYDT